MPVGADRECDPDLCMQCQWTICGQKPPGTLDCHNMKLRLRQHKRVAMGLSHVAGWGAFAQVTNPFADFNVALFTIVALQLLYNAAV